MGIPEKNQTGGGFEEDIEYGISRGIKEIGYGISRVHLRTKWNFQGFLGKNNVELPWLLVFGLGISKGSNTILRNFLGWSFALSAISRGKIKKRKISGGF